MNKAALKLILDGEKPSILFAVDLQLRKSKELTFLNWIWEAFEDLMKNYKPEKLQGLGQKVNERLEIIKKGLIPKSPQQFKQREEGWFRLKQEIFF